MARDRSNQIKLPGTGNKYFKFDSGPSGARRSGGSGPISNGSAGSLQWNKDQQQWHEYHGKGTLNSEGGIDFDDNSPSGKHSHQSYDKNFVPNRDGRPQGK